MFLVQIQKKFLKIMRNSLEISENYSKFFGLKKRKIASCMQLSYKKKQLSIFCDFYADLEVDI